MFVTADVGATREIRRSLGALIDRLDPAATLASDAARMIEELTAIVRLADAGITLLTPRVAESGTWQGKGHRSLEDWLAALAGTTRSDAADRTKTAKQVKQLPKTQSRLRKGKLSQRQAREVADGAAANPSAEQELLDTAETSTLPELRRRAAEAKTAADPDPDAVRRRLHRERSVRTWFDSDGGGCMSMRGPGDTGAEMFARLRELQDQIFREARAEGRHESMEAYLYDALHLLLTGSMPAAENGDAPPPETAARPMPQPRPKGSDAKIIVRIDLDALLRGRPEGEEVCEIAGVGSVPVSIVREWMANGFLAAVITKGRDVHTVAHLGRRFTAHQRTALQWLCPMCANEDCDRLVDLEYEHRIDWSTTRHSKVSEADRMCSLDHDLKTYQGWSLVPGVGRRAFVAPDDPRHPKHAADAHAPPEQVAV